MDMSLYIDVDKVVEVLLVDGWHRVKDESFDLDSYEMHHDDYVVLPGGAADGVTATGFAFKTSEDHYMYGPLTSVLAVKTSS